MTSQHNIMASLQRRRFRETHGRSYPLSDTVDSRNEVLRVALLQVTEDLTNSYIKVNVGGVGRFGQVEILGERLPSSGRPCGLDGERDNLSLGSLLKLHTLNTTPEDVYEKRQPNYSHVLIDRTDGTHHVDPTA